MRNRNLPSLVVAGLTFAYLLTYPLAIGRADESHFLYAAKRVLQGDVLYRDLFESLPPLGFWVFAGIFRLAGTTLRVARVSIALAEAAGAGLLFALARRVSGVPEAVLAVLVYAGICLPTWPYASPHWISTTLGLLVAAVTLAGRWQDSARARPFVAGMLAGVSVCIQQQRGVFVALWLPLALGVLAFAVPRVRRWRRLATEIAWGAAGGAIVVVPVLGVAAWAASPAMLVDALYGFATQHYGPSFSGRTPWADVPALTRVWRGSTWVWLLWLSPLFLLGEGVLLLRGGRPRTRLDLERACLWLLAALMALSIWYLPDFIHVSFVLSFLLIPGASLLQAARSAAVWDRMPGGRPVATGVVWLMALAVAGQCVANVAYARAVAPVRLETGFGVIEVDPETARLFNAVRAHLVAEPDGRRLLYSFPDDAWLYLTLPADDVTRFSVLVPGFFPEEHVREAVEAMRARRAGTVVVATPFAAGVVPRAVEEGYDPVDELGLYRIYVRSARPRP